jgi:molybdopterin molybdotransferase
MTRKNLNLPEAIACVRAGAPLTAVERVVLGQAFGRVLAEAIDASRDQPPFRSSAMDGYAVRRADIAAGAVLPVVGESAAGRRHAGAVAPGQAVRIFTGAPVPDGADAVIIQETTRAGDGRVELLPDAVATPGHIRQAGQDFTAGTRLLEAGVRLDAWRLSLVAAAGQPEVVVRTRPRVAVLCTGDELVLPGTPPARDQVYESGSAAVMALIEQWGGEAAFIGTEADDLEALHATLATVRADLIVTIGGASVGDHDLVKPALLRLGLATDFTSLNLRPGKPTSFGVLDNGAHVLGVPGNPASAFVVAQLLLKPWIESALGLPATDPFVRAVTAADIPANGLRETYLRAALDVADDGRLRVTPFSDQDSSLVSVFARSGALVRLASHAAAVPAGGLVDILRLERL